MKSIVRGSVLLAALAVAMGCDTPVPRTVPSSLDSGSITDSTRAADPSPPAGPKRNVDLPPDSSAVEDPPDDATETSRPTEPTETPAFAVRLRHEVRGRGDEVVRRHWIPREDGGGELRLEWRVDDLRQLAFVATLNADSKVEDYALAFDELAPHRWVNPRTGVALLPHLQRDAWLPNSLAQSGDAAGATWWGRTLEAGTPDRGEIEWSEPRTIELNPDVLIATSRDFRDDGTGQRGQDWNWVNLQPSDYRRMIDDGFNLFRIRPHDWPHLRTEPVFLITEHVDLSPALAFHPAYCGAVMYADEPVIRARREVEFRRTSSPQAAATAIRERTAATLAGPERYGRGYLEQCLVSANVDWADVPTFPYPVWETVASSAWYELEAGADSWCFECRLDAPKFTADVKRSLGVDFPNDVEACLDFHFALFRGASRHFDAEWGVAVYGQASEAVRARLFPHAYDQGARFFWLWTSDADHHVPHAEQLLRARQLREHVAKTPDRTPTVASVALVLPWGYVLDDDTVRPHRDGHFVWGIPGIPFEAENDAGVPHREVLASAMTAAVELLESGERFDILFLRDEENAVGYSRVVRVGSDAKRTEDRP